MDGEKVEVVAAGRRRFREESEDWVGDARLGVRDLLIHGNLGDWSDAGRGRRQKWRKGLDLGPPPSHLTLRSGDLAANSWVPASRMAVATDDGVEGAGGLRRREFILLDLTYDSS